MHDRFGILDYTAPLSGISKYGALLWNCVIRSINTSALSLNGLSSGIWQLKTISPLVSSESKFFSDQN